MKITGIVKETLHLEKTVEIEVPEGSDTMEICVALRRTACETAVDSFFAAHGWETVGSEGIEVFIIENDAGGALQVTVDVCCHQVELRYWGFDHELTPELEAILTEEGEERARKGIQEGYRSGQLCCFYWHDGVEEEIHGWWEI